MHVLIGGSDNDHRCISLSNGKPNNIAKFPHIYCKLGVNACGYLVD